MKSMFLRAFRGLHRLARTILTRVLYRLRVIGKDNVPPGGGALLYVEQISLGDPFLVSASLRREVKHLLWRGYLTRRGPGRLIRLLRVIPIAGTDSPRQFAEALEEAEESLRGGELVCLFAEGIATRSGT